MGEFKTKIGIIYNRAFNPVEFEDEFREKTKKENTEWYVEEMWLEENHDDVQGDGWFAGDIFITYKGNHVVHANLIASFVEDLEKENMKILSITDSYE